MLVLVQDCFLLFSSVFLVCAFFLDNVRLTPQHFKVVVSQQNSNRSHILPSASRQEWLAQIFSHFSSALVNAHRVQGDSARRSCTIKRAALQSCCADKRSVRFLHEVSAYKSAEGAIQIINKWPDSKFPLTMV